MPIDNLTAPERETIIRTDDETGTVEIWTAQRSVLTALRKKPDSFIETSCGLHGSTEWAKFTIPVTDVNFAALARRKGSPRPNAAASLRPRSSTDATKQSEAA